MPESRSGKPKRHRIKIEPEGLSLLQIRMREAHAAALRATERELQGLDPYGTDEIENAAPVIEESPEAVTAAPKRKGALGGFVSQKFNREFFPLADEISKRMFTRDEPHFDLLSAKLQSAFEKRIQFADIQDPLREAFFKAIKMAVSEKTLVKSDETRGDLEKIFRETEERFFAHLFSARDRGDDFKQALQIAANSHWFSAEDVEKLYKTYGKLGKNLLRRAVTLYPANSEGYLSTYNETLRAVLATKVGQHVPVHILKHYVIRFYDKPRRAVSALRIWIRRFNRMKDANPDELRSVLERMALRTEKRGSHIDQYKSRVARLTKLFPDVPPSTIGNCARDYTFSKAKEYLAWYQDAEAYLLKIEPRRGKVMEVLRRNAFEPKDKLEKFL